MKSVNENIQESAKLVIEQADAQYTFIDIWKNVQMLVTINNRVHGWFLPDLHNAIRVSLIHSEVSELLEYLRHGNPQSDHIPDFSGAEEELADVIIRVMDMAEINGWRVAEAVLEKIKFNATRQYKHGGKEF